MLKVITIILYFGLPECAGQSYVLTPSTVIDNKTGNAADNSSSITWSDFPKMADSTSGALGESHGSWEAYYTLMQSFVGALFPKGIPADLIVKAAKMDDDIIYNYQDYVSYFLGYAVCVGVGVLFLLVFPVVSCCFCCCRCCGKCGGKRSQDAKDAGNTCKKSAFTFMVIIPTGFLCVGMVAILANNDEMSASVTGTSGSIRDNVDIVQEYLNTTIQQVEKLITSDVTFMEEVLSRDLDNIDVLVGVPLRSTIENRTNIRSSLDAAYSLASDLVAVDASLKQINTSFANLNQAVDIMGQRMTAISTDLTAIFNDCANAPGSTCPPAPDISSLAPGIDAGKFPDLSGQMSSVEDAMKTNLTEQILQAESELNDIPGRVQNDSASVREDTKAEIRKLKDEVNPLLDEFNDINELVNGDDSMLSDFETDVEGYSDLKPIDEYRRYGWQAIFGLVLLVVIGNSLGIAFGVCTSSTGVRPHHRGCASNSAGCLLMSSTIIILSISTVFMLLTTLPFLIGAPLEMVVCKNLKDVEKLREIEREYMGEGTYELGKLIHDNKSVPLTFAGLLNDCRDNTAIFEAIQLNKRFDIDDMLNYTKYFDIESELDKVNVDLSAVDVYSPALKSQLTNFRDALNVDFGGFSSEMGALTSPAALDDLVTRLQNFTDHLTTLGLTVIRDRMQTQVDAVSNVRSNEYVDVQNSITALNDSLVAMETSVYDVKPLIDTLEQGLANTDTYIQTNASQDIKLLLESYAARLLSVVDSFVNHAKTSVKTEIGRCSPVWRVYESVFVHTLCGGLVDALNGFWFSMGWCVFFFLPSSVFAVKLAKFYRRMDPPPPPRKRPNHVPVPQHAVKESKAKQWLRNNKVYHSDYANDW